MQNSHDYTRMGYNSCHMQSGSGGAPGRILNYASTATTNTGNAGTTTGGTTTTTLSFANDVMSVSLLLQKASNSVNHGGGSILATTSSGYTTICDWIAQGALNN